jgi:signal transduction histidine kinase
VNAPWVLNRIQTKLLLSYLLVITAGIGGLAFGVQLVGPSLFDRMLMRHMGQAGGMMGMGMTDPMRQITADAFRDAVFQAVLISTFIATIVAVLISIFVANRITAPLRQVFAGSQRIAAGDYRTRVQRMENDEIGELATTFNMMAATLEDTEQRRVRLIGDVAHELRTPLTTLRGNLEGLLDGVVEPEPALWAQLHGETVRLSRLVDDLQELSRVESGQVSLSVQPTNPAQLIETAIARLTPHFAEKGVATQQDLADTLPRVAVDADRTVQIVTNLLSNALRYTPPGGSVTVSARQVHDIVQVHVQDTGSGVPAEHLPHIFDRFYRVDRARSRALGGSGIGLSIAKALVEAQGGQIWAESPGPDQGSTFWFTMPVATSG